jgi:hypothetical protein
MTEFLLNVSCLKENQKGVLDFDDESISDHEFKMLTGLSKQNFEKIYRICSPYLRDSKNRTSRNALAIFFVKLRLNISQEVIAVLFGFPNQERVSETFNTVMEILYEKFVPLYLGFQHISRQEAKRHQSAFITGLHEIPEEALGLALDGSYLYIEKPSDFEAQRIFWSMQKLQCLVKPMMISFMDGYLLDMPKCFPGKDNDATILEKLLEKPNGLMSFVKGGDYFFVDKGFRDSVAPLEDRNVNVMIPQHLDKGQQQYSAAEANRMRLVTMSRFVIEVVNGRIKNKFKFFADKIPATYIPKINKLFRIACALLNAFGTPILSNKDDGEKIVEEAHQRNVICNDLAAFIESEGLERKIVTWEEASLLTVSTFPKLTLDDMKRITLGTYQTSLATRYIRQHLSASSDYKVYIHKERNDLLRAKIQSRFRNAVSHQLWIKFQPNSEGFKSIVAYYCKCKIGQRTVGCCAHVTSVIYYLGYCRYSSDNLPKMRNLIANIINAAD